MSTSTDTLNLAAARDQHRLVARASDDSKQHWLAVLGGGLIAGYGLSRGSFSGLLVALGGGGLAYYGLTGDVPMPRSGAPDGEKSQRVATSVTINRPPADIYDEWRDVTNLPRIMSHLVSVSHTGDGLTHWVAKAPMGRTVEWNAEVIHDRESRVIAWRSVGDADIPNVGSVRFDDAPGGRGTEVKVTLEYSPPAGSLGVSIAKLLGEEPGMQIADDLRRFKQHVEFGSTFDEDVSASAKQLL